MEGQWPYSKITWGILLDVAVPSIKTEVKAVDAVLGWVQEGKELIVLRKGAEESQRRLQAFEESVELARLAVALPDTWATNFSAAFTSILTPAERLGLPGEEAKVIWVGSDATTERVFSMEWGAKKYIRYTTADSWKRVAQCVGDDDTDFIVAITELQGFVNHALAQQME